MPQQQHRLSVAAGTRTVPAGALPPQAAALVGARPPRPRRGPPPEQGSVAGGLSRLIFLIEDGVSTGRQLCDQNGLEASYDHSGHAQVTRILSAGPRSA